MPASLDRGGIEIALLSHPHRVEQILRPVAQRPAQPLADRHREPRLGAFEHRARRVAVEDLAEHVLGGAADDPAIDRNAGGSGCNMVIEEGYARLEADRHRRAVDLGQDVVGQVAGRVGVHHPHRVGRSTEIAADV